jgi:hypothetical protein
MNRESGCDLPFIKTVDVLIEALASLDQSEIATALAFLLQNQRKIDQRKETRMRTQWRTFAESQFVNSFLPTVAELKSHISPLRKSNVSEEDLNCWARIRTFERK